MRFDVLGPLRVYNVADRVAVPAGRASAALCWLVLNANEAVSEKSLVRVLWRDPPASAPSRARMLVRALQPIVGAEVLETEPALRLVVSDDAVDARRFERLVTEARRHLDQARLGRAQANLRDALALWRGDPCPELAGTPEAQPVVDRLVELRLDAQEELNALLMDDGVDYSVVAELRAQTILHRTRPRLRRQLALALYRTNRQVEALEVLRDVREQFGDEDGVTADLQAAILRHDPELDGASSVGTEGRPGPRL